jgi:hypothetical protein
MWRGPFLVFGKVIVRALSRRQNPTQTRCLGNPLPLHIHAFRKNGRVNEEGRRNLSSTAPFRALMCMKGDGSKFDQNVTEPLIPKVRSSGRPTIR